ncbi:MAG: TlpA family protein disulfide reductase [Gammaproteobacteria bacterium]
MKTKLLIAVIAAVAMSGGIFAQRLAMDTQDEPAAMPQLSLPDLSGNQRNLDEWRGKVLVVNFWATWCPPCRKEIPEFISLQQELGSKGLQFVGIAIEEKEPVEEYLTFTDINYPILIGGDAGAALSSRFGNRIGAVPFTLIADRQGLIVHRHPGEMSRSQLEKIVSPLL